MNNSQRQLIIFSENFDTLFDIEEFVLSKKLTDRIFTFNAYALLISFIKDYVTKENIVFYEVNSCSKDAFDTDLERIKDMQKSKDLNVVLICEQEFQKVKDLLVKHKILLKGYVNSRGDKYNVQSIFNILDMDQMN